MYMEDFPQKLKTLRISNNLTQDELANILGTTKQSISAYESGKIKPSLNALINLSEHFSVSIDSLIFNHNSNDKPLTIDVDLSLLNSISLEIKNLRNLQKNLTNLCSYFLKEAIKLPSQISEIDKKIIKLETLIVTLNDTQNEFFTNSICNEEFADEIAPDISLPSIDPSDKVTRVDFSKPTLNTREVPIFPQVAAGSPGYTCEDIIGYSSIPEKHLQPHLEYFVIGVNGDSMNKLYTNNEKVLVEKSPEIKNGDFVIASIVINSGDTTLKKVSFKDDKTILTPMSTNPIHKVQIYKSEDVHILGKVLGRLNNFLK